MNSDLKKTLEQKKKDFLQKEEEQKHVENEISRIKQKFSYMEDTDFKYMTPEVRELRHSVLYIHSVLEGFLDDRIRKFLLDTPDIEVKTDDGKYSFNQKSASILDEMEFWKKVTICRKNSLIPDSLVGPLDQINKIRIYFSHPSSYQKELREYRDRKKYLETLQKLESATDAVNEIYYKEHPEWKRS